LRGGPIAKRRLLAADGQQVVLAYEERAKGPGGQAKAQTMRLPLEQFLGRWLLHVSPPRAVRVRDWGLDGHTQGPALAVCRQQLGQGPAEVLPLLDWQSVCAARGEAHPERCPVCGRRLVCTTLIPRAGVPPPAAADWGQVA
jgi:Putative transposase